MMMRATRRPGGAGRSRGNFSTRHVKGSGGGGGGKSGGCAVVILVGLAAVTAAIEIIGHWAGVA